MFWLEIKTGGAAFCDESGGHPDPYGWEIRRILGNVIEELKAGHQFGSIIDYNGNLVGRWEYGD